MPHIIVEHSESIKNNVDLKKLNSELHQCLSEQETVSLESIKTRSIEVKNVIVGSGDNNEFIHINVLLLKGRSENLKKKMAAALFTTTQKILEQTKCKLSVNISDLGTYQK